MEKYTAIIIEPRIHPAWKLVLNNFLTNLDERWNFLIFCGLLNKDFLVELIDTNFKEHKHRITIYQLNIDNFNDITVYSNFMLQPLIYELIPTETFLTFQLDTLISAKYKDYIYEFIEYDYVGAPCGKIVFAESGFETKNYIGNGGLSLRKKSVILNLIKNDLYNIRYNGPEDIFFSQNITNKPTFKKAILFSVETFFSGKSFGIHKCYMHLQNDQLYKIAEYIPEIFELAELNKIHHHY